MESKKVRRYVFWSNTRLFLILISIALIAGTLFGTAVFFGVPKVSAIWQQWQHNRQQAAQERAATILLLSKEEWSLRNSLDGLNLLLDRMKNASFKYNGDALKSIREALANAKIASADADGIYGGQKAKYKDPPEQAVKDALDRYKRLMESQRLQVSALASAMPLCE